MLWLSTSSCIAKCTFTLITLSTKRTNTNTFFYWVCTLDTNCKFILVFQIDIITAFYYKW